MRWMYVGWVGVLAACPGPDDVVVDVDARPANTSVVLQWSTSPTTIPGEASSNDTIDRIVLRFAEIRCVADVGSARLPRGVVEWASGVVPSPGMFVEARSGLYSRLELDLDRGTEPYAYEILGTTEISGDPVPYWIRDRDALALADEYTPQDVPPGATVNVNVRVEIDRVIGDIDFSSLPVIDGRRVLETGNPRLAAVRSVLDEAIRIHDR